MTNIKTMFMGMLMAMTPLYMYATDIKRTFHVFYINGVAISDCDRK